MRNFRNYELDNPLPTFARGNLETLANGICESRARVRRVSRADFVGAHFAEFVAHHHHQRGDGFFHARFAEAVLSYVGIGVDPMMMSFGTLINNARLELGRDPVVWWLLAGAFFAMLLLVLSANLFADALRQALNPREI